MKEYQAGGLLQLVIKLANAVDYTTRFFHQRTALVSVNTTLVQHIVGSSGLYRILRILSDRKLVALGPLQFMGLLLDANVVAEDDPTQYSVLENKQGQRYSDKRVRRVACLRASGGVASHELAFAVRASVVHADVLVKGVR
jgi:hypothetical protein